VVIAESPGREEAERGQPLMGHTGKQFNQELLDAGLIRERLVLIYAIGCLPPHAHTEGDMKKAVRCCNPLFWHQLKAVAPSTPTLICGKWAALAAHGEEKSLMAHRGFVDEKWELKRREMK
jgi:uracil-DNA glycosylase family 4